MIHGKKVMVREKNMIFLAEPVCWACFIYSPMPAGFPHKLRTVLRVLWCVWRFVPFPHLILSKKSQHVSYSRIINSGFYNQTRTSSIRLVFRKKRYGIIYMFSRAIKIHFIFLDEPHIYFCDLVSTKELHLLYPLIETHSSWHSNRDWLLKPSPAHFPVINMLLKSDNLLIHSHRR